MAVVTKHNLQIPVFIVEFPDYFSIDYNDDYEQPEIFEQFATHFCDHQLYDTLELTDKEMIMEITSTTIPYIVDDWGRGLSKEQSIITYYLVKRRIEVKVPIPKTKYYVLFGDKLKEYQIYIYDQAN